MTFKLVLHILRNEQIVEVWDNENFIASIYSTSTGIKIISKYINPDDCVEICGIQPVNVMVDFSLDVKIS